MITWGPEIYVYLWLAGIGGGAYFATFLAGKFSGDSERKLLRWVTYIVVPLVIVGVLLLIAHLGNPIRFWHLFTQFKFISPMSLGTWSLLAWIGAAVIMIVFWQVENRLSQYETRTIHKLNTWLGWAEVVLSVLVMTYTGVLLANSNLPLWSGTVILPALFVASAISTGLAGVILISVTIGRAWEETTRTVRTLAEAAAIMVGIELAALAGYSIWLANSATPGSSSALQILITGALSIPFWLGVVVLALFIPLFLDIFGLGSRMSTKAVWRISMASSSCVIMGGLALRAVIVMGAQL